MEILSSMARQLMTAVDFDAENFREKLFIEECGHFVVIGNGAHGVFLTDEDRKFRERLCAGEGLRNRLGGLMIAIWANAKKLSNCEAWQCSEMTK